MARSSPSPIEKMIEAHDLLDVEKHIVSIPVAASIFELVFDGCLCTNERAQAVIYSLFSSFSLPVTYNFHQPLANPSREREKELVNMFFQSLLSTLHHSSPFEERLVYRCSLIRTAIKRCCFSLLIVRCSIDRDTTNIFGRLCQYVSIALVEKKMSLNRSTFSVTFEQEKTQVRRIHCSNKIHHYRGKLPLRSMKERLVEEQRRSLQAE